MATVTLGQKLSKSVYRRLQHAAQKGYAPTPRGIIRYMQRRGLALARARRAVGMTKRRTNPRVSWIKRFI